MFQATIEINIHVYIRNRKLQQKIIHTRENTIKRIIKMSPSNTISRIGMQNTTAAETEKWKSELKLKVEKLLNKS